jgi:hypothetical protein
MPATDLPSDAAQRIDEFHKYNGQCLSRIEIMRISEILFWNNEPTEGTDSDSRPHQRLREANRLSQAIISDEILPNLEPAPPPKFVEAKLGGG